ncbi:MAG: DUF3826 domain-containing protein [Marinilabiliaceae bacterium]|nr:DUF3826 domain-containing protein [Marinilabiliaceae bacterium]
MNKLLLTILISIILSPVIAQNEESPEKAYTRVITERADKIVEVIAFDNDTLKIRVRDLVMEHYRFLSEQEDLRNADVAKIREELAENKELRDAKIDLRKAEQELKIRDHHFAFVSALKILVSEEQIDQIKDGLTYNVCPNTYIAFQDMIPALKAEEKEQILIWLTEAREHAIDGGSSKEKHGWFGKYKGRINNYLSAQGYDLNKLSKEWHERLKKEK